MEDNTFNSKHLEQIKARKLFPLLSEIKSFGDHDLVEELYSSLIRMLKKTIIPALQGYDRTEFEIVVPERFDKYRQDILSILREAHQVGYEIAFYLKESGDPFEDVVNILAYCVEEMGVDSTEYREQLKEARCEYASSIPLLCHPSKN